MAESYRRRVSPSGFSREGSGLVVHTGAKVLGVRLDDKEGRLHAGMPAYARLGP